MRKMAPGEPEEETPEEECGLQACEADGGPGLVPLSANKLMQGPRPQWSRGTARRPNPSPGFFQGSCDAKVRRSAAARSGQNGHGALESARRAIASRLRDQSTPVAEFEAPAEPS